MMRLYCWLTIMTITALSPRLLYAHGMVHHFSREQATVIRAAYDDGEPMSYADVKIFGPGDTKFEHQNGRTDKHGCFAFVPDVPGQWRLTVDGGMGHMITTDVTVDENMALSVGSSDIPTRAPRLYGIAAGLGIIFGMTGLFALFKSRKKPA